MAEDRRVDTGRDQQYGTQEFAKLAGVTVRALHHYDRLGLLRPRRTRKGYRIYCDRDLERLEQVVALKFVGLPLRRSKRCSIGTRPNCATHCECSAECCW